ncbi:serine/threonine-protein kinase [Microbacterium sp. C7(2022)]|uniref:serine/threonine-protein kinase n=1 Tax=Microbacterium sp. C7(2022) TaxID=2992759 RepID=UPI00237B6761|nr:serine/threonine-protein kinase [Microbacterium sp. C7(2022)]MDE0545150.1 serine/threonine protein kinase [Microbacterium sp. C7(2022)]
MSAKRAPAAPPDLQGFTFIDVLGSGGFADVYLYEQHLPKRRVAVKVLLPDRMSSGSVEEFTAEANVMAMLSTHPAIVTIYQAGVARDGRPYLVMEYCPKPNLQVRYRREPFSVAESLRVGVQVAAAVETAHRAGVLHRDIKPANVLVTEYNRPALTDFGIASTTSAADESAGLSIPWSPPEAFADVPRSDARSDVYQLGATVYSLLVGRSPFELGDQRNTAADLMERIERMPLPAVARADVPVSLQHVLERAMAKSGGDRYESALAFARALQKVQIELSHAVTPIDILDDSAEADDDEDDDDGLTRVRGVVSIDPATGPAAGLTRPTTAAFAPDTTDARAETQSRTVQRSRGFAPAGDGTDATIARGAAFAPGAFAPAPGAAPATDAASGAGASPTYAAPGADGAQDLDHTVIRGGTAPAGLTAASPAAVPVDPAPMAFTGPPPTAAVSSPIARSRRGLWIALGAGAAALILIAVVAVSLPGLLSGPAEVEPTPLTSSQPQDPLSTVVPEPADLAGSESSDGIRFTWSNPDPQDGDFYLYGVVDAAGGEPAYTSVADTEVTVDADASGRTCLEVMTVRANGSSSEPVRACAP